MLDITRDFLFVLQEQLQGSNCQHLSSSPQQQKVVFPDLSLWPPQAAVMSGKLYIKTNFLEDSSYWERLLVSLFPLLPSRFLLASPYSGSVQLTSSAKTSQSTANCFLFSVIVRLFVASLWKSLRQSKKWQELVIVRIFCSSAGLSLKAHPEYFFPSFHNKTLYPRNYFYLRLEISDRFLIDKGF